MAFLIGIGTLTASYAQQRNDTVWIEAEYSRCLNFVFHGNRTDSAMLLLETLKPYNEKLNIPELLALEVYCYYNTLRAMGKIDTALQLGHRALNMFKANKQRAWEAFAARDLGLKYNNTGDYKQAIELLDRAIDRSRELEDTLTLIDLMSCKGNVYHDMREFDKGIKYGLKGIELAQDAFREEQELGYWYVYIETINVVAINYDDAGNSRRAIEFHQKVLDLKPYLSDTNTLVRTYNNIGNSLLKLEEYLQAEKYIQRALKGNLLDGNSYGLSSNYTNLGTAAMRQGKYEEAAAYLHNAEMFADSSRSVEKLQDVYTCWAEYYQLTGNHEQAYVELQRFHALKDSLFGVEQARIIGELETRYQTREKESRIAEQEAQIVYKDLLLTRNTFALIGLGLLLGLLVTIGFLWRARMRKNQELALRKKELQFREAQLQAVIDNQEEERKRYASDLHDGIGQLISVLRMNMEVLEQSVDSQKRSDLFTQSREVLNGMYSELRTIIFNLMPQGLTRQGLKEALHELALRSSASGSKNVCLQTYQLDGKLSEKQQMAIYRIVQEWINNVLKYSDAKQVDVQLTGDQQEVTLMIEDNGRGFDRQLLENSQGNGWKNIRSRVQTLGGDMQLDTHVGQAGTVFIVDIPFSLPEQG